MVIVGAGFGGLSAARALAGAPVDIVLIDRHNYHVFQPLLYQVATAGLSPADIASPIRAILSRQRNVTIVLGTVGGIDKENRAVLLGERRIGFDYLVVATGARHSYFGHDAWERVAPGLKTIDDATAIRRKVLLALERAESSEDEDERRRLTTFAIIGAGPTGVELAGAIAELVRVALAADFRRIDPSMSRIILVEAGPRILPSFPECLSAVGQRALARLGVQLRLGAAVTACDEGGLVAGGESIAAGTVLWAAGVAASPAAAWLEAAPDRNGRVMVEADLTLPGDANIFVIGDTAHARDRTGKPLPGVAPVAKQQGLFIARTIIADIRGSAQRGAFRYRDFGNLATIGRKAAVAEFGFVRLSGRLAWLLWGAVHIYFLIGFRNRLAVVLDWLWAYVTFQRGARLITGADAHGS
ncbi:MAG TPA: NAD(P)/FAD-dependent oxidoreductase [Stellaceae bacterium]|nr:NAD(P)/FAD-dependent oxidoreductase [Stellaceae bacterium]